MDVKTKDLWVLIETKEDGTPRKVGLELLNPSRRLADKQEGKLVAVVIGCRTEASVQAAGEYGAGEIIVVDPGEFKEYSTDAYAAALTFFIEKYGPITMLIGAAPTGRDLGSRLSCRLKTELTADRTSLDVDAETDDMVWTRSAFGGDLMATILCPDCRPQLGAAYPGVLKRPEAGIFRVRIIKEAYFLPEEKIRITVLEITREAASEVVDLEGAKIIVSGGRGSGGSDGFKFMRALANVLGTTVGASRAAVDAGWVNHSHQVGQTGETIAPKIYTARGISGVIQYMAGVNGVGCIIAINKDPEAPIFDIADYGIVGNLFEVVPAIMEEIKEVRA